MDKVLNPIIMLFNLLTITIIILIKTTNAATYIVAPSGGDFTTIQEGLNAALPGDTILVRGTGIPYFEKLNFVRSGQPGAYIHLLAYPGEFPVIDGTGIQGSNLILIHNLSYLVIEGFELRNNLNVNDGSAIRITGTGSSIRLLNNKIHNILGQNAMAITIYGTSSQPISDISIIGNDVYDCEPAQSEAITLNGNVTDFMVINNSVSDVNNIGIDFIGGETDINPDTSLVARNGICSWNTVFRANSNYGGGYAAGIYVDGGRDIVIENNIVSGCDLGIEVGAENHGIITRGIVVRSNLIYKNEKAGLIFGGYDINTGRVKYCIFNNNTLYKNDVVHDGTGEISLQYCSENSVFNNICFSNNQNILVSSAAENFNNSLNYNLYYCEAGGNNAEFYWNGNNYQGLAAFQSGTGQDLNSIFNNPLFVNTNNNNFRLLEFSPAIDNGDPSYQPAAGETDLDGNPRIYNGRVDMGAYEYSGTSSVSNSEEIPEGFVLFQNYPNPFNPSTVISWQIPASLNPSKGGTLVTLKVYDLLSSEITTLVNEEKPAGIYEVEFDASFLSSGIYFYQLTADEFIQTKKMVLIR